MTPGEVNSKRWRFTILDLFIASAGIAISLGVIRLSITADFVRQHTDIGLFFLGHFMMAATIGGSIGKIATGTTRGAAAGCCWGIIALILFGCIGGLISASTQ